MKRQRPERLVLPTAEIVATYLAGASVNQLAQQYGCDGTTIVARLRRKNIVIRSHRMTLPDSEIAREYLAGATTTMLAAKYDCDSTVISDRLRRQGIQLRKGGMRKGTRTLVLDAEIIRLYVAEKWSVNRLAKTYRHAPVLVVRYLRENGVTVPKCGRRFGVPTHTEYKGAMHHAWRADLSDDERAQRRDPTANLHWRHAVYERDGYACLHCEQVGGVLNAHHVESYSTNRTLRWELSNGVTLCRPCHKEFHKQYGNKNNTAAQFAQFLAGDIAPVGQPYVSPARGQTDSVKGV